MNYPLFKIGPDENPFVFEIPFNPLVDINQVIIDKWLNNKFLILNIIESHEKEAASIFKSIRIFTIPDEICLPIAEYWTRGLEGGQRMLLKYHDYHMGILNKEIDSFDLWKQAQKLGALDQ